MTNKHFLKTFTENLQTDFNAFTAGMWDPITALFDTGFADIAERLNSWNPSTYKKVIKDYANSNDVEALTSTLIDFSDAFEEKHGADWVEKKIEKWLSKTDFDLDFFHSVLNQSNTPQQSFSDISTLSLNGTDYVLTFNDDFDTFEARQGHGDDGIWSTSFSPHLHDSRTIAVNGEGQFYVDPDMTGLPNPFSVDNGILSITAHELDATQQAAADGMQYSSGLMSTELAFGMDGGYIEISARVPDQQGFLSAFWLLPQDGDWSAEIDIFETLGHLPDTMNTNVWDDGTPNQMSFPTIDMSDGFHTYGLEWTDTEITWYIDGEAVRTVANTVTEDMYLVLSLAVDTNWTGAVDATTDFTDSFDIDYIRVYETDDPSNNAAVGPDEIVAEIETYGAQSTDENLYGTRWADTIDGAGGNDEIFGRDGNDLITGGAGADSLFGQNDDDALFGGDSTDTINGGDGEDYIEGGAGTDHMWGGTWSADGDADVFAFNAGDGRDFVHSFEDGLDLIDVSSYNLSWGDLSGHLVDQGWATFIDLEAAGGAVNDGVFVLGVSATQLTSDDFILGAAA